MRRIVTWALALCCLTVISGSTLERLPRAQQRNPIDLPNPDLPNPDVPNPIVVENSREGTSDWRIEDAAQNHEVEGYASATSVAPGQTISFFVNVRSRSGPHPYTLEVFRLGWYGGLGGRRMAGPYLRPGIVQPPPHVDPTTHLVECDWHSPFTLTIPTGWVSGVYLVRLVEHGFGKGSYIPFVVRRDGPSDILFQQAVTTYHAYNPWGGHALYKGSSVNGVIAQVVSFNRPYGYTAKTTAMVEREPALSRGTGFLFWWDINALRFLEREGYDVSYSTNIDTHRRPADLLRHRVFLSVGHDEYWSTPMRNNLEAALAAGVNLAFLGSNPIYWRVRLIQSPISRALDRTMVAYKNQACVDDPWYLDAYPSNDERITTKWRDSCTTSQSRRPEAALVGVQWLGGMTLDMDTPMIVTNTHHWAFQGTGLQTGDSLYGLAGYEVDSVVPRVSPSNIEVLAASPIPDVPPSHMTIYEAASGALVFATGTMNWNWGLDGFNPDGDDAVCCYAFTPKATRVSAAVQQITRNVLDRMLQ